MGSSTGIWIRAVRWQTSSRCYSSRQIKSRFHDSWTMLMLIDIHLSRIHSHYPGYTGSKYAAPSNVITPNP